MTARWTDDERADRYADYTRSYPTYGFAARTMIAVSGIAPGSRVLDLGCGTGIATRFAADRVGPAGRVVGVDSSEAMLRHARRDASRHTTFVGARAEDVATLGVGPFDVVLANMAMWQFDVPRVLDALVAVTVPGSVLAFTDGHWRLRADACRPRATAAAWVRTLRTSGWGVTRLGHADHASTAGSLRSWSRLGLADPERLPTTGTACPEAVRLCVLAVAASPPVGGGAA